MRRITLTLTSLALTGTLGLAACGSDKKSESTTTTAAAASTVAPEDVKASPAEVAAGLTKLPTTIAQAIAAIGTPDAEAKTDAIEDQWFAIEGTIRDTDTKTYLDIEDNLANLQDQLKAKDPAGASTTAVTLGGLFTTYLAAHPG
jgi:hypothetical protein